MACRSSLLAVVASAALASIASPSLAAPPLASEGCSVPASERVIGEIKHSAWPIVQSRPDGSEIRRTYTVHVPPQHQDHERPPLPIVFDLHGAFLSGFQQNIDSRMSSLGNEKGFIVAQPDSWPWWATAPTLETLRGGGDDVEYMALLLDLFDQKLCFDRNRIFVVGGQFYGSAMGPVLACASSKGQLRNHRIAAVAAVTSFPIPSVHAPPWEKRPVGFVQWASWLSKKWIRICPELSSEPIPLLVIFSSNDLTLAPLFGGLGASRMTDQRLAELEPQILRMVPRQLVRRDTEAGRSRYQVAGEDVGSAVELTLKLACFASGLWSLENGCLSGFLEQCKQLQTPVAATAPDAWGALQADIKPACFPGDSRKEVRFVVFGTGSPDRNGHIWPGGLMGGAMNATEEIWDFFQGHPR